MTTYTITADQLASIKASRLQHLDNGDEAAADALGWVLTAEPSEVPWSVETSWSGDGNQIRMWTVRCGDLAFPSFNLSDANRLVWLLNSSTGKRVPRKYLGKDGSPRICEEGYGAALPSPVEAKLRDLLKRARAILTGWTEEFAQEVHEALAAPVEAQAVPVVTDEMVGRFLGWRLPDNFSPDCLVSFDKERAKASGSWPRGTNLLDADQAKAMLQHVLGATLEAQAAPVDLIDNIAAKVSGGLCSTTMEGKHAFLRDILALIAAAPTPSKGEA